MKIESASLKCPLQNQETITYKRTLQSTDFVMLVQMQNLARIDLLRKFQLKEPEHSPNCSAIIYATYALSKQPPIDATDKSTDSAAYKETD